MRRVRSILRYRNEYLPWSQWQTVQSGSISLRSLYFESWKHQTRLSLRCHVAFTFCGSAYALKIESGRKKENWKGESTAKFLVLRKTNESDLKFSRVTDFTKLVSNFVESDIKSARDWNISKYLLLPWWRCRESCLEWVRWFSFFSAFASQ